MQKVTCKRRSNSIRDSQTHGSSRCRSGGVDTLGIMSLSNYPGSRIPDYPGLESSDRRHAGG